MSVRTVKFGGSDFTFGESPVASADINDTFNECQQEFKTIYSPLTESLCLIGHNSTDVSHVDKSTGIRNTTNYKSGNITWVTKNANIEDTNGVLGVNCQADRSNAIALEINGADSAFTANDGVTWTDTTTNPPNATNIYDISFPTTSLAVCCGVGGAERIWRSTDGGANWAEASSGAGATVFAIAMLDGTTGFAVDGSENIWKTTDGGDNWADTGIQSPTGIAIQTQMHAINSTTYLISIGGNIYKGTDSVQATLVHRTVGGNVSKFVKTANGNVYNLVIQNDASGLSPIILNRSTDNGTSFTSTVVYAGFLNDSINPYKMTHITEAADNVLLLEPFPDVTEGFILELNVG